MQTVQRTSKILSFVLPLLLVAIAGLYGGYAWVLKTLEPPDSQDETPVVIEIPSGASVVQIADTLHQSGLVQNPTVFRYYSRYLGLDGQMRPGEYQLSRSMKPEEILARLTRGEVVQYRFTVPEGLTVVEMANHLAAQGLVDRDRLIAVANEAAGLVADFLPPDVDLRYPLEGYLFPDTYQHRRDIGAEEIVELMVTRFRQVMKPEYLQRAEALGLTVHELITLASIIEEEAAVASERAIISGVYHNRMAIGMKLDADPTVRYALEKPHAEPLLYRDLEVESPYNTYRNATLPPGPISAPGEASIHAALWPESHDYFFFVAKDDGTGEHYFSHTLDEHEALTDVAAQNRAKRN